MSDQCSHKDKYAWNFQILYTILIDLKLLHSFHRLAIMYMYTHTFTTRHYDKFHRNSLSRKCISSKVNQFQLHLGFKEYQHMRHQNDLPPLLEWKCSLQWNFWILVWTNLPCLLLHKHLFQEQVGHSNMFGVSLSLVY